MNPTIIVLDANSIYSKDPEKLLAFSAPEQLEKCRSEFQTRIFLPEMALAELRFQKIKAVKELRRTFKNLEKKLCASLGVETQKTLISEQEIEERIRNSYFRCCSENGIELFKTPIETIDWERILEQSVSRLPPFEDGNTEKGFRDAIILETASAIKWKHADSEVILISADGIMTKAAKEREMLSFRTIEEFRSAMRLRLVKHATKRLEIYTLKASKEFISERNVSDLIFALRTEYPDKFEAIPEIETSVDILYWPNQDSLKKVGHDRIIVGWSLFQGEKDGRYTWDTSYTVATLYEGEPRLPIGQREYIRELVFKQRWSAEVSKNGDYGNKEFGKVQFVSSCLEYATPEKMSQHGFPSTLDRLRQLLQGTLQSE